MAKKRIAIVYDWMDSWGGVERMLLVLHEMFPTADWFTSYIDPKKARWIDEIQNANFKMQTSFIQNLPSFIKSSRLLSLPLYPVAFENFDLREYDIVISITSSFAKSVITHPGTKHVCILLTPTRWLWSQVDNYTNELPLDRGLTSFIRKPFVRHLQKWDSVAAQRPDKMISIAQVVADRCKAYYHRDSEVIYPPFDFEYWSKVKSNNKRKSRHHLKKYFLVVSRLEPYKKVDMVIRAFQRFPDKRLVIVGTGTQSSKLMRSAGDNIYFIQNATDDELGALYIGAQALIMPQEEDFGYVSLEAQFFGCPVIAYGKGGALETVMKGKTGLFFSEQSARSLGDAVAEFKRGKYNLGDKQAFLKKFSKEQFVRKTTLLITNEQL